jgi:hypothetical protein
MGIQSQNRKKATTSKMYRPNYIVQHNKKKAAEKAAGVAPTTTPKSKNHFIMAPKEESVPITTPETTQHFYVPTVSYPPSYVYSHYPLSSSMQTHTIVPFQYGWYCHLSTQYNSSVWYSAGYQQPIRPVGARQHVNNKSTEVKNVKRKPQFEICCAPYRDYYLKDKPRGRPPHCPLKCRRINK